MNKNKLLILSILLLTALNSCKKTANHEAAPSENTISKGQISIDRGILKFANQQQLTDLINDAKRKKDPQYIDAQIKATAGSGSFNSFYNIYKTLDALAENNKEEFNEAMKKYPQINSEDEILNDEYFSRLVNENKEIIMNGSLYKISKEGVLVLGSKDINSYLQFTKDPKLSPDIFVKTQKYKTLSSARFVSTPLSNTKETIGSTSGYGTKSGAYGKWPEKDMGGGGGDTGTPPKPVLTNGCKITYHDYSNVREYEYFPNNLTARIKVKFFANDWLIYKTIGIKVVVQKQTSSLFDWWGSYDNHTFVKANINQLAYRIKKKDFFPPLGVYVNHPSLGSVANSLLKSAVKIQVSGDMDILAFDIRDLAQRGVLSSLLGRIPDKYSTGEDILTDVINNRIGAISDKLFGAMDKELGAEFQGKKTQKAFYYKPVNSDEPILIVQNIEYASYGSGIIDETLVKEWQGFLIGVSSDPSGNNLNVNGIKALDVSDIEVMQVDVIGSGSVGGSCVGIGLRK